MRCGTKDDHLPVCLFDRYMLRFYLLLLDNSRVRSCIKGKERVMNNNDLLYNT